jgi:hypothetical protein
VGRVRKKLIQALKEATHRVEGKRIEGLLLAPLAPWRFNLFELNAKTPRTPGGI